MILGWPATNLPIRSWLFPSCLCASLYSIYVLWLGRWRQVGWGSSRQVGQFSAVGLAYSGKGQDTKVHDMPQLPAALVMSLPFVVQLLGTLPLLSD